MPVFTHERIKLDGGLLAKTGILWGGNALQSINITRNTPANPQQAIGKLGIVDYTTGVVTSEVSLDCVLVESCDAADSSANKANSVYRYARQEIQLGVESYVLTSVAMAFAAGQPATVNYGYMTPGIASHLAIQDQPDTVEQGEESSYAVVMGDDGSGIALVPTWDSGYAPTLATVRVIDATGALTTMSDSGLPEGVQSLNMSASINRDNVLDVRTAQPVQFVTTYPLTISLDMNIFNPPVLVGTDQSSADFAAAWDKLLGIAIESRGIAKHPTDANPALHAAAGKMFVRAIGFKKVSTGETVSVGQYLAHSVNYTVADLVVPLPQLA